MNTEIQNWLKKPKYCYVNGSWVDSSLPFYSFNPATEQPLSTVFAANDRLVNDAVVSARDVFQRGDWASLPIKERASWVKKLGDLILEHRETLAVLESLDTGKPLNESLEGDVPRAARNLHFFADFVMSEEPLVYMNEGDRHVVVREPMGVAALITPWNLPLYLETWKLAPALLMGNSVVLKPSELTPLTASYLTELIHTLGLPKGVFNLVHGFGENAAGQALVSHSGINAISFTGETSTGRAIMRSASQGPTRVSFELGGKGACVVFADAHLGHAVEEGVRGAFRNQGEICLANSRIYLEKPIYEEFMRRFKEKTGQIRLGDPLDKQTTMGALISRDHLDKVLGYIQKVHGSGKITLGGARPKGIPRGYFLEPTIIEGLSEQHPITIEEVFGPVVSVYPFSTEDEVIRLVNQTPYGLSSSVWTQDNDRAQRMAKGIRTGLVWVNSWFVRDLRVPFGGWKRSGIGREGGRYSMDFFSEWKSVCYRGI